MLTTQKLMALLITALAIMVLGVVALVT